MADTLIQRTARERHRALEQRLAADIRGFRLDRGLSQRALAAAAGIDHALLCRIEAGEAPTLKTLAALATALGMEASVKLFPATGPRIHDRTSAPITNALLALAHARWTRDLEVAVTKPARGVIDVVFADPGTADIVAAEIQGQLRRVEERLRWAGEKADSLPSAVGWPWKVRRPRVSRLLVLRSTYETRALVRGLPELFRAAYPATEEAAWEGLTSPTGAWPANAMLWAEATGGSARILDGAPRSSGR